MTEFCVISLIVVRQHMIVAERYIGRIWTRFSHVKVSKRVPFHHNQKRFLPSNAREDDLKSTLGDIKKKYEEKSKEEKQARSDSGVESQSFSSSFFKSVGELTSAFVGQVQLAYYEMIGEQKDSSLKRKIHQADSFRPPPKETTHSDSPDPDESSSQANKPSAIVMVQEGKSTWEAMKERLQDSPLIREILKNSRNFSKVASTTPIGKQAQNLTQNVQDKVSDLREFWETSQNPLVYTVSGIWENVTGETEEGLATAAIRRLDPRFVKEEWANDVRNNLVPLIIKAQLVGDLKTLRSWLGEAVYNKLAADIKIRKSDGIEIDPNILNIDENGIFLRILDDDRPVIAVAYLVQQINCIRKRGEIIEGSETDIRAKYYTLAFQQVYDENTQEVSWQIIDYDFSNDFPYY